MSRDSAPASVAEQVLAGGNRSLQMLAAEGFATCAVDDAELFNRVRERVRFQQFAIGVGGLAELEALGDATRARPLVLLAPLRRARHAAHLRVAFPDVALVDRGLRDPDAIRRVLQPPPADAPEELVPDAIRQSFEPFGLTERQLEVVRHALLGRSSQEIARGLFISEPTVRNHLHAIYDRVGVGGRREMLGRFIAGMIERGI